MVADDFNKPNGIAFSPDEKTLYVADTGGSHDPKGEHHIRSFTVEGGRKLTKGKVFAEISPGLADGFRLDVEGNLWTSAGDGVHCYTPQGKLLGKVKVPEVVSNVCFGGPKRNRLFIRRHTRCMRSTSRSRAHCDHKRDDPCSSRSTTVFRPTAIAPS